MLKPGKTFKLSKTAKRMIALMKSATDEQRNQYKRMMIQAELSAGIIIKSAPRDKNAPRNGGYTTTSNSATPSAE